MADEFANTEDEAGVDRRMVLRRGAAVGGVAAAAWAAPAISGIGLAPASAQAGCSQGLPTPPTSGCGSFTWNVSSNSGALYDPAEWTGVSSGTKTFTIGGHSYTGTGTGPSGNVDNPCGQTVASGSAVKACSTAPTPPVNCTPSFDVTSCPPAGIANDNACWRAGAGGCSAALNGSASGTVTITCCV